MELFKGKKLWMPDMLADGCNRGGKETFVIYQRSDGTRQDVTYREIQQEAQALLQKLKRAGLHKGDRLAVVSAMRPWWFSLLYAALQGGYRMVCIDPGVPAGQIQSMLRQTEARAVFTTLRSFKLPMRLEGRIPVYGVEPGFPCLNGCEKVDFLLESPAPMPKDTFFILFSSGTTGENRKGVLLPHTTVTRGIEYGMSTDAGIYKKTSAYTVRKRDLMLFPPYHIAGLLCAVFDIYNNTEIIMLERLTPNALTAAIEELKPDNICTVPSMLTLLMKNSLLDQIAADYVRTVIAKGATRRRAIWCHAFRNALIPVATGFGSIISLLFAGSIIIETIFEIPGMGRLSWDALVGRDYAVFLALLALTASFQLIGNLISDVLYMIIDPRVDFGKKG